VVPVAVKLRTILDANDAAVGRTQHKSITSIEEGTITAYGVTGHYRDVSAGLHSGDDFRSSETLGPFTSEFGRYHGTRWRRNENGITNVLQDTVRADENDILSFISETENPKNDVTLLGEVTMPVDAYVIQVKRKNFYPFWAYYDKQSGLLDRIEIGFPTDRQIITYDDYRLANGIRQPWHTRLSGNNSQNTLEKRITSSAYGVAVSDQDLAIPRLAPTSCSFRPGRPKWTCRAT
jgi:hypothetical protein